MTPGKLGIDPEGRITGAVHGVSYNDPWPCKNGSGPGVTGAMQGVVMHTCDGSFQSCINAFNADQVPPNQKSANFVINEDGQIHQFFPLGQGYMSWHAEAANLTWYGVEHSDNGNPDTPLTSQQITSSAQLVELLSRFTGFPLKIADKPVQHGFGVHNMGGAAWGGHTCPDVPPEKVRSSQRQAILDLAAEIRTPPPAWQKTALEDADIAAGSLDRLRALLAANQ